MVAHRCTPQWTGRVVPARRTRAIVMNGQDFWAEACDDGLPVTIRVHGADALTVYNPKMERDISDVDAIPESVTGADWPPIAGAFVLGSAESPVAVCTLATQSL